ncbi:hypothetical protein DPMN_018873 [Dreissena polymorpha]|uniref:Uncharacterized protein n=1 Tax=Dreissena polymorpha TaxID=45954 RepID=A0A9D4NI47_DREPO|nr:hypothetical protein DPMN_018873 [Dreissena polymorpha]
MYIVLGLLVYLGNQNTKDGCPCGQPIVKRFTLHKLADMSRTGVGKPRPLLDQEKLDLFRVAKKFDRLVEDLERKMRAALGCLKET